MGRHGVAQPPHHDLDPLAPRHGGARRLDVHAGEYEFDDEPFQFLAVVHVPIEPRLVLRE